MRFTFLPKLSADRRQCRFTPFLFPVQPVQNQIHLRLGARRTWCRGICTAAFRPRPSLPVQQLAICEGETSHSNVCAHLFQRCV